MKSRFENALTFIMMHVVFAVYSLTGVCSKSAAQVPFLSIKFCLWYAGLIVLLGLYAVIWQQIIKRVDLVKAYSNKAVAIVWGIVWGYVFFNETVSIGKLIGAGIIIAGTVMFFVVDKEKANE